MDAGKLDHRIDILHFDGGGWQTYAGAWTSREDVDRVIYSSYAQGKPGAKFVLRARNTTLDEVILCGGKRYMIAEIRRDKAYETVTAAEISFLECIRIAPVISGRDAYNRPVYGEPERETFPGILAEKYVNFQQEQPNAVIEHGVILTTPKAILLAAGDELHAGGAKYAVKKTYLLDMHKNDYELVEKRDA